VPALIGGAAVGAIVNTLDQGHLRRRRYSRIIIAAEFFRDRRPVIDCRAGTVNLDRH